MPPLLRPLVALLVLVAVLAAPLAHAQTVAGGDIDAEGPITALGESSLTVGGLTFTVTPQTDIHDDDDHPLPFSALTVGLYVDVEGYEDASGSLIATEIEVEDDQGDETEAEGPITALSDSSLTVAGRAFAVTALTVVVDDDDNPVPYSTLTLGLYVEVEGYVDATGTAIAMQIEVEEGDEIEAEGLVLARTDSSLTVGGLTFAVTASTVVVDDDDQPIPYSEIVVGVRVDVDGELLADGRLVATEIELDDEDDGDGTDIEVEGLITALTADAMTVGARVFALTATTVVVGDDDQPLTLGDLAVGLRVDVDGRYDAAGTLAATRIEIEDFDDNELEVTGPIEALSDSSLTVAATLFEVTPQTVVLDRDNLPILFGSLTLGQVVEVKSTAGAAGQRVATRIKLQDATTANDEIVARAALDAVTDSVAVVLGRPFVVVPTTQVLGLDDEPVALADLPLGESVEVRARRDADGRLVALVVERKDDPATAVRLRAAVTAVSADSLSVLDVAFDAATAAVIGIDGLPTVLDSVMVGQTVEVTGSATETGVVAATVQILRAAQAAGRVAGTTAGAFTLPGVTVTTTGATLFVDETGAPVTPEAIATGAAVRATGTLNASGQMTATRVTVLVPAQIVAGEAAPEAALALEAPFPNPAVQYATVRYTLAASATVAVEVFDALGRSVLRVDAGDVPGGRHEARLDTARLPAGLYLVRLLADGRPAATQTLTVVR